MPVINRIADYTPDMTAWRRYLHTIPELMFECHQTAAFVVERLKEFGITKIHEGIATTGIVAIIRGAGRRPHDWPACRYGCASDARRNRPALCVHNAMA